MMTNEQADYESDKRKEDAMNERDYVSMNRLLEEMRQEIMSLSRQRDKAVAMVREILTIEKYRATVYESVSRGISCEVIRFAEVLAVIHNAGMLSEYAEE